MYNFFIDGAQLPIAPSEMTVSITNKNETVVLIDEGEINILKRPGLTNVEFSVMLPNVKYPFAVYPNGFQQAATFLDKFEKLKANQKPFQLIVNRIKPNGDLLFDTNLTVALEEYQIKESADEGFDVIVDLKFKQYRAYGNKRVDIKTTTSGTTTVSVSKQRATVGKESPKSYTVKKGDTLWALAKKHLGDGKKYTDLAKLNNIQNPNLIYPGQVIRFE